MVLPCPRAILPLLLHPRLLSDQHLRHQHRDRPSRPPRRALPRHPPHLPPAHRSSLLPHRPVSSIHLQSTHLVTECVTKLFTECFSEQLSHTPPHHPPRASALRHTYRLHRQRALPLPPPAPARRALRCLRPRLPPAHAGGRCPATLAGRRAALDTPCGVSAARRRGRLPPRVLRVLHGAAHRNLQSRTHNDSPSP